MLAHSFLFCFCGGLLMQLVLHVGLGAAKTFHEQYSDTTKLQKLPFDTPADHEAMMGFTLKAPAFWANGVRKEQSMRIMLLGGSNAVDKSGYSNLLAVRIADLVTRGNLNKESYVMNEGIDNAKPKTFLNKKFDFETTRPKNQWPNIICFELSVDGGTDWDAAIDLEVIMRSLNALYLSNKLRRPAFLFLDLNTVAAFYSSIDGYALDQQTYPADDAVYWTTPAVTTANNIATTAKQQQEQQEGGEIAKLNPPNKPIGGSQDGLTLYGYSRGTVISNYHAALARFYACPMISFADATFPSFTRYYVKAVKDQKDHSNQKWPFSKDGKLLSRLGASFFVEKLLMPFLQSELNKPISSEPDQDFLYKYDIHLFAVNE